MCSFLKWNSLDFAAVIGHVSRHPVNLSLHSALPADECMQAFQLINLHTKILPTKKFPTYMYLPYFDMRFKSEADYFIYFTFILFYILL